MNSSNQYISHEIKLKRVPICSFCLSNMKPNHPKIGRNDDWFFIGIQYECNKNGHIFIVKPANEEEWKQIEKRLMFIAVS